MYDPTQWENGDIISEERMNKLEQGVADASAGCIYYVEMDHFLGGQDNILADKTWNMIADALMAGKYVVFRHVEEDPLAVQTVPCSGLKEDDPEWGYAVFVGEYVFQTSNPDGDLEYLPII